MTKPELIFPNVIEYLKKHAFDNQIGNKAHLEIAPYRDILSLETNINATLAAVLLLVYPINNIPHFVVIKRPTYNGNHSNQIALPGGKKESTDLDIIQTAIREAQEEVNVSEQELQVISQLSPLYIPNSNFNLTPVLAFSESKPNFIPDQREVEQIIEIPLFELLQKEVFQQTKVELSSGIKIQTPYLQLQNQIVWGATGMILNEFRQILLTKF